jgi:hypothetical protein
MSEFGPNVDDVGQTLSAGIVLQFRSALNGMHLCAKSDALGGYRPF